MSDFGEILQQYAEGGEGCQHPINKVVELPNGNEACTLCGMVFHSAAMKAEYRKAIRYATFPLFINDFATELADAMAGVNYCACETPQPGYDGYCTNCQDPVKVQS